MASVLRFVALWLLISVCAEVVTAQTCNPTDSSALQYFCREFVYARTEFSTWKPNTDCCSWQGVACDGSGNVVSLNIQNIDQNPPYPTGPFYTLGTGLLGMKSLTNITMKNIAFDGGIPGSWGTLSTLIAIHLESCNILGPLPAELCQLTGLLRFNIFDNFFNGVVPTCFTTPKVTFPSIQELNMTDNNFSG